MGYNVQSKGLYLLLILRAKNISLKLGEKALAGGEWGESSQFLTPGLSIQDKNSPKKSNFSLNSLGFSTLK